MILPAEGSSHCPPGFGVARLVEVVPDRRTSSERRRRGRVRGYRYAIASGTSFDLVDTAGRQRQAEIDLTVKEFELLRARVAAFLALASCNV